MALRFSPQKYKDCETCDGEGFVHTGTKSGFNVKNMEATMEDDGHHCPECMERSQADYECEMENRAERRREEER